MGSAVFVSVLALTAPHSSLQQIPATPVASAAVPTTSGSVEVDLKAGRIDANVCFPTRSSTGTGSFALNAGLNVARVFDKTGKPVSFAGWYNPGINGEARIYKFEGAPSTLCVRYVGAFPVYSEHDAPNDFKGVIAFNGDSVRATEQSLWLPLAFDEKTRTRGSDTAYDLNISCQQCRFIYVNGSPPLVKSSGHFHSAIVRPALLFAGTGAITSTPAVTIVNEDVNPMQQRALVYTFGSIQSFYRNYMGQPVSDQPTLLRMVTLDEEGGHSWGFATWPTIALSGSVGKIASVLQAGGPDSYQYVAYVAHEIGHYYFGTVSHPSGPYSWFLIESTAEFLSIKAQNAVSGGAATTAHLAKLKKEVARRSAAFVALDKIIDADQVDENYRYSYAPLLLESLDRTVGDIKMRAFMRGLMNAPRLQTWADISEVATRAGIDEAVWKNWTNRCVANGTRACVGDSDS